MNLMDHKEPCGAVLVCGGGVAGIQASLDLSKAGFKVYLVEKSPTIGGRMARLDKTFPTGDCATCIISPKLVECMRDYNIDIITMADLVSLDGQAGDFIATVQKQPRSVNIDKCTGCGDCWMSCPVHHVPQEVKPIGPVAIEEETDREFIATVLNRYKDDPAPLMPALQDINDDKGYLPRPMLEELAFMLKIPVVDVLRTASFYNAFSLAPVGRHIIEVCIGSACFVRGSGILLNRLEEEIDVKAGFTDKEKRFTLRTVRCIGCCALAPAMRIDGVTFGKVKMNKIPQILELFV